MTKKITVNIIGAGIGGLTTAIALQQKGVKVQIFERTNDLKPVGAGIILANNAMQIYEKLGLKAEIESKGNPIHSMNITGPDLKPLSCIDLKPFEQKYGCQNIAIHRGELQQILTEHLEPNSLNLGYELIEVKKEENDTQLKFQNGKIVDSQITLGADGLNSTVRKYVFPKRKIRDAFQICWRGVTDFNLPENLRNELNEAWGMGDRFGLVQLKPNLIYWYALKSCSGELTQYSIDNLNSYFSSYNDIVGELIGKTNKMNIHTTTISDLKLNKRWYKNSICLIGDAAHATTPNMGQGACQAIEDAYILTECIYKFDMENAFSTYQTLRFPKVQRIVNLSWRIGKMAHWKNPIAIKLRSQLIKLTPKNMSRNQSEKIFELETV